MKDIWGIKNIVKSVFISLEAAFLILSIIIKHIVRFEIFDKIGVFLFSTTEIMSSITIALPIGLFAYSLSLQKNLLQPKENNKQIVLFQKYKEFKQTTYVGVMYTFLPIIPTFISIVNSDIYISYDLGFYYSILIIVSIISLISMYISTFTLKEILDVYS